jgi:hypothetical protein
MGEQQTLQLVDAEADYNTDGMQAFATQSGLENCGQDYQIIAVMGPQSSGKSTLMNAAFGTKFTEMDALSGRHQTTRGIWLARSPKLQSQALIMDLEGSDGRERGEDDTSFERQSALFALSAADVLLVNMWAKDIGRETGAGKPLLKTIFQVNLKLFTPAPGKRRTVLLFVFRDRTKTPLARLVETWEEDLHRMWAAIPKPPTLEGTSVTDFFEVKYAALPNFEEREEDFRAESVLLRRRFTDEADEGQSLVRPAEDKLPGHALPLSMQRLWQVIREQKDLNLPAHKVMVANIRCEEIAADQLAALLEDQAWASLKGEASAGVVADFGQRASTLLHSCLTGYDEEARYFEAAVRADKRAELVAKAYAAVAGVRDAQLAALKARTLQRFQADLQAAVEAGEEGFSAAAARLTSEALGAFEEAARDLDVEGSGWTAAETHAALEDSLAAHVHELTQRKVAAVLREAEARLAEAVTGAAVALLDSAPPDFWPRAQRLHQTAVAAADEATTEGLVGYELGSKEGRSIQQRLDAFGRKKLEAVVREGSHTALSRMKDRFSEVFSRDESGLPRSWGPRADVPGAAAQARGSAAHLLSLLAVIRTDVPPSTVAAIEASICSLAAQHDRTSRSSGVGSMASSLDGGRRSSTADGSGLDMLSLTEWPGVPQAAVLLPPGQCRSLWRQFVSDSNFIVQQAVATQEANRAASNRMPPIWAIAAMVVLGWNEFFTALRNPLWLVAGVVMFLFFKTVWQDLEVENEMSRGLLPGLVVLSGKLAPTLRATTQRTLHSVAQFAAEAPRRTQDTIASVRSPMQRVQQSSASSTGPGASLRRRNDTGVDMTDNSSWSKHSTQRGQLFAEDGQQDEASKDK